MTRSSPSVASVVAMRTQAVPHAYRAFFRQIGLELNGPTKGAQ